MYDLQRPNSLNRHLARIEREFQGGRSLLIPRCVNAAILILSSLPLWKQVQNTIEYLKDRECNLAS